MYTSNLHQTTYSTFWYRLFVFVCILIFGASLPFLCSGYKMHSKDYLQVNLDGHVKQPVPIDDIVIPSSPRKDLEIVSATENNKDNGRPKFAKLILDIQNEQKEKIHFLFGNISLWASIVLLTGLCVAQWVSTAILHALFNDFRKAVAICTFNLTMFAVALYANYLPIFGGGETVNYIFYYVLPVPVLIAWFLYGIWYVIDMKNNLVPNIAYTFFHYVSILLAYSLIFDISIPWL